MITISCPKFLPTLVISFSLLSPALTSDIDDDNTKLDPATTSSSSTNSESVSAEREKQLTLLAEHTSFSTKALETVLFTYSDRQLGQMVNCFMTGSWPKKDEDLQERLTYRDTAGEWALAEAYFNGNFKLHCTQSALFPTYGAQKVFNLSDGFYDPKEMCIFPAKFCDVGFETIDLTGFKNLGSLPKEFSALRKTLKRLVLKDMDLGALPNVVYDLDALEELDASDNGIMVLRVSGRKLPNLKRIDLSANCLATVMVDDRSLTSLVSAKFQDNCLVHMPQLGCKTLEFLNVSDNQIWNLQLETDTVVVETLYPALQTLVAHKNRFKKITPRTEAVFIAYKNLFHLSIDAWHFEGFRATWTNMLATKMENVPRELQIKSEGDVVKIDYMRKSQRTVPERSGPIFD